MDKVFLNGAYLLASDARISPNDRGFLFADGVYEVVRGYRGFFLGMQEHQIRLKRSLEQLRISWDNLETFPQICEKLIVQNNLLDQQALVYFQISRGTARRTHHFPFPSVPPTEYGFAVPFSPNYDAQKNGVQVAISEDIRWKRCDIKSISLLGNVLTFQEAKENNFYECLFFRNNAITEATHSNVWFVKSGKLYTHPESNFILSGITRLLVKNLALKEGLEVCEEAVPVDMLDYIQEAFLTSTSAEVTPITTIGERRIGEGRPGPVTRRLQELFLELLPIAAR